jgi:hypothetical protein
MLEKMRVFLKNGRGSLNLVRPLADPTAESSQ